MTSSNASEWIKKHILLNIMGRKHSWNISSLCNITKEKKNFMAHFLWMGFSCLKAAEPLLWDSLLFTT